MCELCELCELFVKTLLYCTLRVAAAESDETIPSRKRWDCLICPQQNLFVTFRIFRRWLLSCILMSRVVRLLQRAEEGCEGLKHGYYDLPCVHFLIFLCCDIKNKIDRLFFYKEQRPSAYFAKFYKISRCRIRIILFNLENRALLVVLFKRTKFYKITKIFRCLE